MNYDGVVSEAELRQEATQSLRGVPALLVAKEVSPPGRAGVPDADAAPRLVHPGVAHQVLILRPLPAKDEDNRFTVMVSIQSTGTMTQTRSWKGHCELQIIINAICNIY